MGMKVLARGQWSPCGSGGGGDCLVLEVADAARGDLVISDTDRTFRGKVQGHEVWQLAAALVNGDVPEDIMKVIREDVARYEAEMAETVAACPVPALA